MAQNALSGLIPRGSLGLKLLLVCVLVVLMSIPLMLVGAIVTDRQMRAGQVTAEIGERAGGAQIVGGPMLVVPFERTVTDTTDSSKTQIERGSYIVFAETGSANATLTVEDRRRGIYRAATYIANTEMEARFRPAEALAHMDPSYRFDWANTRVALFVHDSRAIRDAAELRFADGSTATLEPVSDLSFGSGPSTVTARSWEAGTPPAVAMQGLQAFAADAPFTATPPAEFTVHTQLKLGGAQRFALAAFALDTTASIRGNRRDVSAEGYFQTNEAFRPGASGFAAAWRVPYVARHIEKAANLATFNLGEIASRDMAVSFVAADDVYNGVVRAVRYGIMFIGIVFLAALIFEAVSGRKAHPAQYVLVGLAQCVFYLLLLAISELIGFNFAFAIGAIATVGLLAYYAGSSFRSRAIGFRTLAGMSVLYGAMYVLMTLEDYAMLAGTVVTWIVVAATLIATRKIDWYGRATPQAETAE